MDEYVATTDYTAVTVVSPILYGDMRKDQDRARWCEPGLVACVCDGVSSSPNSAKAAEIATSLAPTLFGGDVKERLGVLCDLLMAHRQESLQMDDVSVPEGTTEDMRRMLQRVVRDKRASSFQTTMIAARIAVDDRAMCVDFIQCGDSAFFAFSPQGELLASSLASSSQWRQESGSNGQNPSRSPQAIRFGPGDEILVRVEGPLSEHDTIQQLAGVRTEHVKNWVVCSPIDSCRDEQAGPQNLSELHALSLQGDDRLVIPRYLYGRLLASDGHQYRVLRYSSAVKVISRHRSPLVRSGLGSAGSATRVLPDHFYAGAYESFHDSFPLQTQFLLCSDGFYGAFADWPQLYEWLTSNAAALGQEEQGTAILEQLHGQLNARKGDDDISFVWAKPTNHKKGDDHVCGSS